MPPVINTNTNSNLGEDGQVSMYHGQPGLELITISTVVRERHAQKLKPWFAIMSFSP